MKEGNKPKRKSEYTSGNALKIVQLELLKN